MNSEIPTELLKKGCEATEAYLAQFEACTNETSKPQGFQQSFQQLQASKSPERLHQMRVQCRALLANLPKSEQMTGPVKNNDTSHPILSVKACKKWLKNVIKQSNAIRDLDVLLTETWQTFPNKLQQKLAKTQAKLEQNHTELERNFCKKLCHDWFPEIQSLCHQYQQPSQQPVCAHETNPHPEENHSQKSSSVDPSIQKLEKQWLSILEQLQSIYVIPDDQLHQIRLKVKKIRYKTQLHDQSNKTKLQLCKLIQTQLGLYRDQQIAYQILKPHLRQDAKLTEKLRDAIEKNQQRCLQTLHKQLKKLRRKAEQRDV